MAKRAFLLADLVLVMCASEAERAAWERRMQGGVYCMRRPRHAAPARLHVLADGRVESQLLLKQAVEVYGRKVEAQAFLV